MRIETFISFIIFLLITSSASYADQEAIVLHAPLDRSVIEYDILNISVAIPEGTADLIKVSVNGKDRKKIIPDAKFECFSVKLEPGISTIDLSLLKGETVIATFVRNVFRRSDLVAMYKKPPDSFKKAYFHMKTHPKCKECHILGPIRSILPDAHIHRTFNSKNISEDMSACKSCHINITGLSTVHDPVAAWTCLDCHNEKAEIKYSVKQPFKDLCNECHSDQIYKWNSKKYIHGPLNAGGCPICHNPHSSDNASYLFRSTWDLCVTCHADRSTGFHVLGSSILEKGHPTKGVKDPARIGKELTCASCHDPHASNYPHLWAFAVEDVFELCMQCHFLQ